MDITTRKEDLELNKQFLYKQREQLSELGNKTLGLIDQEESADLIDTYVKLSKQQAQISSQILEIQKLSAEIDRLEGISEKEIDPNAPKMMQTKDLLKKFGDKDKEAIN